MDLDSKDLLTMGATGKDDSKAEDFREALDAILGVAKFAGQGAIGDLKQMDPKLHGVASEMLKSLKATAKGKEISFVLPKPDGFEDAVTGAMENFGVMMMGGIGPGGMGPGGPGGPPPGFSPPGGPGGNFGPGG